MIWFVTTQYLVVYRCSKFLRKWTQLFSKVILMLVNIYLLFIGFILLIWAVVQSKVFERFLNVCVHIIALATASSKGTCTTSAELFLVLRVFEVVLLDIIEFQIATFITISEVVYLLLVEWVITETTEFVASGRWARFHH